MTQSIIPAPIEMQAVCDLSPYVDEVYHLSRSTTATLKFKTTKDYLRRLSRNAQPGTFFIWRRRAIIWRRPPSCFHHLGSCLAMDSI